MGIGFIERALLWIVLLPLLGALINGVAGRRADKSLVTGVAVGSVFGAFLLTLVCFGYLLSTGSELPIQNTVYTWFSITVHGAEVPIHVRFVMDHLSGIMTLMVTGIGALIHVYSVGYMGDDPGYARFMTYLNLFMGSMLILVLGSSLPLMFVGWEGVGLCSYLLIGFWYTNADYAAAGRKAFVVNRIGDFGVLMGMFLLVWAIVPLGSAPGTTIEAFDFTSINQAAPALARPFHLGTWQPDVTVATLAVLFILLGCAGKSAQIPLYVWLPDAMAGPTPVSALIHAATMVTAGVYLMVRLSPLVVESPFAMTVIAIVGALTALLAASIALVQNQMKKILAYSTVSQLGFMFAAVGMGAFAGGVFHVFTHAFFKACLFLGAGSVMHAVHAHGDADIRWLGGLKQWLPKTHITFAIATAAIAGLPLLSGFFSKDEILLGAATWGAQSPYAPWVGWVVFGLLVLAAIMTAFYMFRLYFRTFHGEYKGGHAPEPHEERAGDAEEHGVSSSGEGPHHGHEHEPHESPDSMTVPLYVLAAGAVLVGFLGLPHVQHVVPNWWSGWLTPQYEVFVETLAEPGVQELEHHEQIAAATSAARREFPNPRVATLQFDPEDPSQNVPQLVHPPSWVPWLAMGLGTLAGLLGLFLAYNIYYQRKGEPAAAMQAKAEGFHKLLMNKWYVDELYGATVVAFNKWLAVFAANLDRFVVDGLLARVTAGAAKASGFVLTRTQTGAVYAYAGMFVVGLAGMLWWFAYPHPDLRRVDEGTVGSITWNAGQGLGYEYQWDWESDGEWDTEWTRDAIATHSYQDLRTLYGLTAIVSFPDEMEPSPMAALRGEARQVEMVLEPGDDPEELPVENLVPVSPDNPVLPTVAYRNVVRVDGRIPSEQQPAPSEEGQRRAAIELSLVDERGEVIWGPERHTDVAVQEGGGFSVLLGANEALPGADVAAARGVRVSVGGLAVEEHPPLGEPTTVLLLRINGAMVADNQDGLRDGLLALAPGRTVAIGRATLSVGAYVHTTVAVRNGFGNQARSSHGATLRMSGPPPARTAQLGAREENAQ